jgi:hypothetical protein
MMRELRTVAVVVAAAGLAACGGGRSASATVGPAGGTVATSSGVTLRVPPGAVPASVELRVVEPLRGEGQARRVRVEPLGVSFASPVTISIRSEDGDASDEKLVEIEHQGEVEVEHGIETERHDEAEHEREAEIGHSGEFEVRHAHVCDPGCDAGFECDDGLCKPHPEDEHPVTCEPACDAGFECDDGVCVPHPEDPPAVGVCEPACDPGLECDASDGICKPHGGGSGGSGSGG